MPPRTGRPPKENPKDIRIQIRLDKEELQKLGFEFPDSRANFIFARHPRYDAGELFEALKKQDIYVRHWDSERIRQYLRITVGTREEMEILFRFLRKKISD